MSPMKSVPKEKVFSIRNKISALETYTAINKTCKPILKAVYKEQCEKGEHKSTMANASCERNMRVRKSNLECHS